MGTPSREAQVRALLKKYDLTIPQYQQMYREQGGRCAICRRKIRNLLDLLSEGRRSATDHDHLLRKRRKLLCTQCNTGLGMFEDSIRLLSAAIVYLEDHDDKFEYYGLSTDEDENEKYTVIRP